LDNDDETDWIDSSGSSHVNYKCFFGKVSELQAIPHTGIEFRLDFWKTLLDHFWLTDFHASREGFLVLSVFSVEWTTDAKPLRAFVAVEEEATVTQHD
jgi:hypothetical protein